MTNKLGNILVVDDEHTMIHLLKDILENKGFSVSTSLNGFDAIKMIKKMNFDFILTDIQMPKINGIEVLKQIKKFNQTVKIFMMTGCASIETQHEALEAGACCVLSKPLNIDNLINILQK